MLAAGLFVISLFPINLVVFYLAAILTGLGLAALLG